MELHPGIIYAANLCGADVILNLGGIAAIASMAYGCFNNPPVDFLVGAGNQYVAEAKTYYCLEKLVLIFLQDQPKLQ